MSVVCTAYIQRIYIDASCWFLWKISNRQWKDDSRCCQKNHWRTMFRTFDWPFSHHTILFVFKTILFIQLTHLFSHLVSVSMSHCHSVISYLIASLDITFFIFHYYYSLPVHSKNGRVREYVWLTWTWDKLDFLHSIGDIWTASFFSSREPRVSVKKGENKKQNRIIKLEQRNANSFIRYNRMIRSLYRVSRVQSEFMLWQPIRYLRPVKRLGTWNSLHKYSNSSTFNQTHHNYYDSF